MKREGKKKTFLFFTLVTPSFLQTQSTHKLQNKQKHKNSRTCELFELGQKTCLLKVKANKKSKSILAQYQ
jgi:hypothetical protein